MNDTLQTALLQLPEVVARELLASYLDGEEGDDTKTLDSAIGALEDNLHDMSKSDAMQTLSEFLLELSTLVVDWNIPWKQDMSIGDIIGRHVPLEYHWHFIHPTDRSQDARWWMWPATSVVGRDTLKEILKTKGTSGDWKACAEQCLIYAFS